MTADIETPFGAALPPWPDYSITVHLPKWSSLLQFIDNAQEVVARVKSIYPRFGPFAQVKELVGKISTDHLKQGNFCLLFGSKDSAEACREFLLSENRKENKCGSDEVEIKVFDGPMRLWATCFPAPKMPAAIPFWQDQGTGISYRMAQDCLDDYESIKEIESNAATGHALSMDSKAFDAIKTRIVSLLDRSPVEDHSKKVGSEDVFLYSTGMAAIYQLHRYLQASSYKPGTTILFGFAFHSTPHVYKEYSKPFKWFGKGDEADLEQLEQFCVTETDAGRPIQAVWLEFPSNPNLRCANLGKLKALADKFGFLLLIDDTISSFCNVDLLGFADALLSSLTKSFSGYADVMGGSVVLNPNSKHYQQLKDLCKQSFINEYYSADVEAIERNSNDYLERSKRLNDNALAVVEYLHPLVNDPSSAVSAVAYPAVGPGEDFYKSVMRPATADFKPGYGCLFSVELESIESTVAFYDNLYVHNGPHLGANLTLALPYVKGIHAKELAWMEECGMNERMIRISVGLEETDDLVRTFKTAVEAANAVKNKDPLDKLVNPVN